MKNSNVKGICEIDVMLEGKLEGLLNYIFEIKSLARNRPYPQNLGHIKFQ